MNEWKKASEELPPLDTPVWAGWFNRNGSFITGLFVLADDGSCTLWCLCEDTISYNEFGAWMSDDDYPVSHWMHLPASPEKESLCTEAG